MIAPLQTNGHHAPPLPVVPPAAIPIDDVVNDIRTALVALVEATSRLLPLLAAGPGATYFAALPKQRPATVNERMLGMLAEDPSRINWTCRKWATAVGTTNGNVHGTAAWRRIMTARSLEEASRRDRDAEEDRHHR